jgi:dTDP-4-dehydrorhamnose reductase
MSPRDGMRILVAGAGGMLGRDFVIEARERGHDVIGLNHAALDITDPVAVDGAISTHRPEVVVNCAAYTDVDGAESDERSAMRVNDEGAALVASAAASIGAKLIQPSTDYVFDGSSRRPYVESDLTGAISAYGRSKLGGETSVAAANPRHFIVRASWLFGIAGKNFVETMLRLGEERPEVLVVSDQVGCPTYTRHLGEGIAQLLETDEYGIHHMAADGECSWYEFAQEIFDQAGVECRVMAGSTEMLARPAPRPAYSVLGTERPNPIRLPHWRQGLAEYLAEREVARQEAVA